MRTFSKILLAVAAVLLTACDTNIFNDATGITPPTGGDDPVVVQPEIISVGSQATVDDMALTDDSYSVNTIFDSSQLSEGSVQLKVMKNEYPQLFYLTSDTDESVIMMARDVVQTNKTVTLNEESTALALVMVHPAFLEMSNDDYDEVKTFIQQTQSYPQLLQEVKNSIAARADIFNVGNTPLMVALNNVLEDLFAEVADLSRAESPIFTRATTVTGINKDPFTVTTEGRTVTIRNTGLVPTYELEVYHGSQRMNLTDNLVKSRSSYGILDLLNPNVHLGDPGEPCQVYLSSEGEYKFYFDRTTEQAQHDFRMRLLNDALSIMGLGVDELIDGNGGSTATGFLAGMAMDVFQLLTDPDAGYTDWVTTVSLWTAQAGVLIKWENVGKILGKTMTVYNALKGIGNEIARIRFGLTAPYEVEFCLCQYESEVTTCTRSFIRKVSGDNQEGYANQRLILPLVVATQVYADDGSPIESSTYQKVKFEVVSGHGSLSRNIVGTEADSNEASTYWTLGEEGDQEVKAVVIDMVTGKEVSDPIYFTATIKENADLTVRLDWNKLSGNTDIDLHVTDPFGEEIYFAHTSSNSGGWLDRDDIVGPGPEHIYWTEAPSGTYLIQVHYYSSSTQAITSYSVSINANGRSYGPYRGSIGYHDLVTVGVLNLPEGTFTRSGESAIPSFIERTEVRHNVTYPFKK